MSPIINPSGGGGGGSQPGVMQQKSFLFTERATAGTYTASSSIPAGTVVFELEAVVLAGPWAADTALLKAGDSLTSDHVLFDNLDLVNSLIPAYTPQAPLGQPDTDLFNRGGPYRNSLYAQGDGAVGIHYLASDTITASVTTTIASPPVVPAGELLVTLYYFAPVAPGNAAFA